MAKEILFEEYALHAIERGIDRLADAVKVTMGPLGRNVVFDQKYDVSLVTNDGVTIAKQIELQDPFENIGANLIKSAAIKSNETSGDGTTAAVVLAHAIIKEGLKNITAGANLIILKKGIEKACSVALNVLSEQSIPVNDIALVKQIATISANNDDFVGQIVSEAFEGIGLHGVVTVEDSQRMNTVLQYTNGIRLDNGYLSKYFVNNEERRVVEFEKPYILLVDKTIKYFRELVKILEEAVNKSASLLIIAQDIEGEALSALALNTHKGAIKVAAVKCPGYGDTRKRHLEALSVMLNATVVTEETGMKLENCGLEVCGLAQRTLIEESLTVIQNPAGANSEAAVTMTKKIRQKLAETTEDYEIEKIQITLSILSGGMSLIIVGGVSELEMFERKYRIEDAVHAVYAAIEDGIVPGGGKAFLLAVPKIEELIQTLENEEKTGAKILSEVLKVPVKQIAFNAGVDGNVVVNELMSNTEVNYGFDALKLEYKNLMDSGIIDPTKVIKDSLINAVSVATMLLTSNSVVAEK
ncbi:MAG: chaperonin GroEL [Eubacteriales bacterium]